MEPLAYLDFTQYIVLPVHHVTHTNSFTHLPLLLEERNEFLPPPHPHLHYYRPWSIHPSLFHHLRYSTSTTPSSPFQRTPRGQHGRASEASRRRDRGIVPLLWKQVVQDKHAWEDICAYRIRDLNVCIEPSHCIDTMSCQYQLSIIIESTATSLGRLDLLFTRET